MLDERDVLGSLAGGAFDLFVAGVANQQDRQPLIGEPLGLMVHFGDQRTRGVDGVQAPPLGLCPHRRRDAVCGEDDQCAIRHFVQFVDEDGALGF